MIPSKIVTIKLLRKCLLMRLTGRDRTSGRNVGISAGEAQLFSTLRTILTAHSEASARALDVMEISGTKPGGGIHASPYLIRVVRLS